MARLCRAGREAAGLEGFSPALRAWASNFSLRGQSKVTNRAATPAYLPDLRRVPSAHPLVRRHAPTGLWLSPSMASAKARFEHPCSRAKSGRAALALARFGPWSGAARSTSCLAAWTSGLASANKRGGGETKVVPMRPFHVEGTPRLSHVVLKIVGAPITNDASF